MRFHRCSLPSAVAVCLPLFRYSHAFTVPVERSDRIRILHAPKDLRRCPSHQQSERRSTTQSREDSLDEKSKRDSLANFRRVAAVQKFTRLPVWPAWNGVLIWAIQKVFGDSVAARVEDQFTGRVCPNFFDYDVTSPFIMLVHHCHSFAPGDPLRWFQRLFFPEGFPAHPHRGFVTLTYFLAGGFTHRDSMGVRQSYGASGQKHHSQWLNTGAGVLHEEMFDLKATGSIGDRLSVSRQELYQLWINLPSSEKMKPPSTVLLGQEHTPHVCDTNDSGRIRSTTLVLAGSFRGKSSAAPIASDMTLLHVQLFPPTTTDPSFGRWEVQLPSSFKTAMVYVRQGSLVDGSASGLVVPTHSTAYFERSNADFPIVLYNQGNEVADFMFLAGAPLNEPCAAQGSMVMNTYEEINKAYTDYQRGMFGRPWDHQISDHEWHDHVEKYPSQFLPTLEE